MAKMAVAQSSPREVTRHKIKNSQPCVPEMPQGPIVRHLANQVYVK
jgi:hypothetical protein